MANFANIVNGQDEVVILADTATVSYFDGKLPSTFLIKARIEYIWIRDFSPVIPSKQVKFTYLPQSQSASVSRLIDDSFENWFLRNKLNYHTKSSIILDGGNVVDNSAGTRVIVTDRILKDNPSLTRMQVKERLEHLLGANQVAIIQEVPDDTTGHADGMVMWATNNKILLHTMAEPRRTQVINGLESSFPGVRIVEVPDYYQDATWKGFSSACNIFVNSVVTDDFIYMPTFNSKHDDEMLALIQSHTDKIVLPVPAENVCFMGGSVRCLSWQVKGANKANILQ
jgi:agmatine/peptidylarginine deiminase